MASRTALFVAPSAYPLGGVATWLDDLLPGLEQRGWRAVLGLVSGPNAHDAGKYLEQHPTSDVVLISCGAGTRHARIRGLTKAITAVRPDVVLSVNIPDSILAVEWLRRRGGFPTRAVMTCHGIESDLFEDMAKLRDTLDGVVCTNRLAAELAETRGRVEPDRSYYAAYGTEIPGRVLDRPLRSPMVLAVVGRIEQPQKRIRDLIPLAQRLAADGFPFRLQLAGAGPEETWLRQQSQTAGVEKHFEFLGRLSSSELVDRVYQSADALLLTSVWETGPIVVWEAMAHGCPVITSDYVGNRREGALQHDDNCLMFDVGDMNAAATQIQRLASIVGLRERLVQGGRRLVEDRYSVAASIDQWDEVLLRIIDRPVRAVSSVVLDDAASGRLDRWFGAAPAEMIRRILRKGPPARTAGAEWPHSLSRAPMPDEDFRRLTMTIDREAGAGSGGPAVRKGAGSSSNTTEPQAIRACSR